MNEPSAQLSLPASQLRELAADLHSRERDILRAWLETVRASTPIGRLPEEAQRDHLSVLLSSFIQTIEGMAERSPATQIAPAAEHYALSRMAEAIELPDCIREIEALRDVVCGEWLQTSGEELGGREQRALHLAMDALTREAVDAYARMQKRELEALDRISSVTIEGLPLEDLLRRVLSIVVETATAIDTAGVFLLAQEQLVLRAVAGLRQEEAGAFRLAMGEGFAGRVAAERRPIFVPSAASSPQVRSRALHLVGVRGLYGLPLVSGEHLVGVVTAGSLTEFEFPKLTLRLLQTMAGRIADVIAFAQVQAERERLRSDLAEAAAVAQARAAELDATIEGITDGILIYDRSGAIVRLNCAANAILGFMPEDSALPVQERIRRRDVRDASGRPFDPSEIPGVRALHGETARGVVMQVTSASTHNTRWVATSSAPIRDRSGEPIGAVTTFTDITDLRQLQQRQQDMLRMISHDLRSPLSTASMQAQLLLKDPATPPDKIEARGKMLVRSIRAMEMMIQDLVDMAQLETGKVALRVQPIDVGRWIGELLTRLEGSLDMRRVQIGPAPGLPPVSADPERLERIIVNLLSNALKYSPNGSPVLVEVAPGTEGGVDIRVIDHGSGFPKEDLPRIFGKLYRAEQTKKKEGLGMGLYITRLLVEAHRGRIDVYSEPERGSTFTVWLPSAAT